MSERDLTRLRLTCEVTYTASVNLVDFFTKLSRQEQGWYWKADLVEAGYCDDDEWGRPMAWLYGHLDNDTGGGGRYVDFDDSEGWEISGKRWNEQDFKALVAAVPWMAPRTEMTEEELAQRDEDEARIPGPHDVPLFDLGQEAS